MSNSDGGWAAPGQIPGSQPQGSPPRVGAPGQWLPPAPWGLPRLAPLGGLATALSVLLPLVALADVGVLAALGFQRWVLQGLRDDSGSVTIDDADASDTAVGATNAVYLLLLLATGVVFLVWFHRVRRNAGVLAEHVQRRSPGWAVGGWFCPVVNFWYPYQIATDALYAVEIAARGPATTGRDLPRPRYPLLSAWWALFVIRAALGILSVRLPDDSLDQLLTADTLDMAATLADLAGAVLAVAVVRRITTTYRRLTPPRGATAPA